MKTISLALCALALSAPAIADVIIPGPPLPPINVSKALAATMTKAARTAVTHIFDFSLSDRPEYLNVAYRSAGKLNIARVDHVASASIVGNRVYVLAVTDSWLGPQTIGPTYSYFQCTFDNNGNVASIDIL
jgi:hypothetical protein